jgi:hypothetical protein
LWHTYFSAAALIAHYMFNLTCLPKSLRYWIKGPLKQMEYEQLRRKADKICRKKKRVSKNESVQKIDDDFRMREPRKAYKDINYMRSSFIPILFCVRMEMGI